MKGKKKAAVIAGVFVAVLLIALAGLYTAFTWNTMPQEEKTEPSSELLGKVVQGALNGEEVKVPAEELSAYLAYLGENTHNALLQEMTMTIGEDDQVKVWIPVSVYGMDITASFSIRPEFSGDSILLHMEEAHAGILPLPPSLVLEQIKSYLPQGVELEGDTLTIQTPQFSLKEQGIDFSVGLQELCVKDGNFIFRTDSVSDAIQQLLELFLNSLFSSGEDTLS